MTDKTGIEIFDFHSHSLPEPIEQRITTDDKYVPFGNGEYYNLFPNYLLSLYNESPIHSAIINSKTTYILGDGLKYANGADLDFKVNSSDNIKEFTMKIVKDFLIFNAFAVEVVTNKIGQVLEYHHVPVHFVRMNNSKNLFWVNDNWALSTKSFIKYEGFSTTPKDFTSKIFYYDGYNPSSKNNVYSLPEYYGASLSIATDIAIRKFNLNNIKNHFSVSSIITFFTGGNGTDELKAEAARKIRKAVGEDGEKVIVDFQTLNGKPAEVQSLSSGDWANAYNAVSEKVSADIFIGHSITSPQLFGVKTEGQLGGATELEISYEIFKGTYVRVKRDDLESALNYLFSTNKNIKGSVVFADKPLFSASLSDVMKEKVLTIDEIRAEAGLPPLAEGKGTRLISETSQPTQFQLVEQPKEEVKKKSSRSLTDEDYEQIKDMGSSADDFEIIEEADDEQVFKFAMIDDVAKWVIDNDVRNLTLPELVDVLDKEAGLKVAEKRLQGILKQLNDSGLVKVDIEDGDRIKITPNKVGKVPDTDSVFIMYKYEKRPSVTGADLLSTSRGFCVRLIGNNRLYTRQDIQSMGKLFQYDVFKYAGGFYYNPDTDTTTAYCRHQWKAYQVKRKTK
ncbi:MAG: hypothetical protein EOO46_01385 [Flavobacterium sp.]|nr:MAG: hypothetical protein EOO46_01385 [Flavobacterium sp.]